MKCGVVSDPHVLGLGFVRKPTWRVILPTLSVEGYGVGLALLFSL